MRIIFEQEDTEGITLVDTRNAFKSLNKQAALLNNSIICPQISIVLLNTYRLRNRMIFRDTHDILSREVTTQGNNLEVSFYALGITPMNSLGITSPNISQLSMTSLD